MTCKDAPPSKLAHGGPRRCPQARTTDLSPRHEPTFACGNASLEWEIESGTVAASGRYYLRKRAHHRCRQRQIGPRRIQPKRISSFRLIKHCMPRPDRTALARAYINGEQGVGYCREIAGQERRGIRTSGGALGWNGQNIDGLEGQDNPLCASLFRQTSNLPHMPLSTSARVALPSGSTERL